MHPTTKATLSPGRKLLVEIMAKLNHGRILGVPVENGEPRCDCARILRTLKFPGRNGSHEQCGKEDFYLKNGVTELFEVFDREESFMIEELVVVNGLPVGATLALEVSTLL